MSPLPLSRTPPFFPFLISLMVSVDVKHHVYLLNQSSFLLCLDNPMRLVGVENPATN